MSEILRSFVLSLNKEIKTYYGPGALSCYARSLFGKGIFIKGKTPFMKSLKP